MITPALVKFGAVRSVKVFQPNEIEHLPLSRLECHQGNVASKMCAWRSIGEISQVLIDKGMDCHG